MGQKPPSKSGLEGGWGWIIHPHPPSKPDLDGRVPHDGDGWAILGAVTMDHICAGGAAHHPECRKCQGPHLIREGPHLSKEGGGGLENY